MKTPSKGSGTVKSTGKMAFCHGSVCVGDRMPTNCICPTTKK